VTSPLRRKLAAEVLGTFALVFAGTGAIVVNEVTHGVVTHVGVSLTFGLIIAAMIYAVGDVSGAHMNPAVTLGFWAARRFPAKEIVPYIAAQCAGATAGSFAIKMLFPDSLTLGATAPSGSVGQTFLLEVLLTALLMFVILGVSSGPKELGVMAGLAIGGVVALEALLGGPISGASMNPARSLGPAIVGGAMNISWIYILGPLLGASLAVACCRIVHGKRKHDEKKAAQGKPQE
jgi:MIP family channel proteins